MAAAMEKMEAQLTLWSLKIDHLKAKTQTAGVQPTFDALMYIDQLKALHAIARSKLDQFRAAQDTERARLEGELKSAWNDLENALRRPMPWA